jgi:hypothetical protein
MQMVNKALKLLVVHYPSRIFMTPFSLLNIHAIMLIQLSCASQTCHSSLLSLNIIYHSFL